MTVSTSVGRELNIGKLVANAYRLAGLMNAAQVPNTGQKTFAKELLETIVDMLQGEGVSARASAFELVSLDAGTYKYSLSANALDVIGDGAYIRPGEDTEQASGETPVQLINGEEWQALSNKSSEGPPTLYYPYRVASPVQVWLWPIPHEDGYVRFRTHRKLADADDDNATLDLETYWHQFILWELAHQLAASSSLPVGRVNYYSGKALEKKIHAKSQAGGRAHGQMMLDHSTPWRRR